MSSCHSVNAVKNKKTYFNSISFPPCFMERSAESTTNCVNSATYIIYMCCWAKFSFTSDHVLHSSLHVDWWSVPSSTKDEKCFHIFTSCTQSWKWMYSLHALEWVYRSPNGPTKAQLCYVFALVEDRTYGWVCNYLQLSVRRFVCQDEIIAANDLLLLKNSYFDKELLYLITHSRGVGCQGDFQVLPVVKKEIWMIDKIAAATWMDGQSCSQRITASATDSDMFRTILAHYSPEELPCVGSNTQEFPVKKIEPGYSTGCNEQLQNADAQKRCW